jgi:transcriptional regulator with XRE-family HTH domain
MRIAARIREIRLERSVTLEDLEAKTGFAKSLMARLEKGREVPTLAMLDTLARALDAPLYLFFFDTARESTPRLTRRRSLQELAAEYEDPAAPVSWSNFIAGIKAWSGLILRALTRDKLMVSLESHRASQRRDARGDLSQGTLRRLKSEMKLLVASLLSWL